MSATSPAQRSSLWPALLLVTCAALLPVTPLAAWMAEGSRASRDDLTGGVWILKGSLILMALLIAANPRILRLAGYRAETRTETSWDPTSRVALIGLLVLTAALRVVHLDTGIWLDEMTTLLDYVGVPFKALVTTYERQNNHPLYSLLGRLSYVALGGAEWTIRVPAVLFGIISVGATYRFARTVTTSREAWLAAGLLAVSYHHVWFSQNARGYTALLTFAVLGTHALHRILSGSSERPARDAWAYGLWMALAVYTHLTAALIVIGHAAALGVRARGVSPLQARARRIIALSGLTTSAALSLSLYAVILPQVFRVITTPTMDNIAIQWTRVDWLVAEVVRTLSHGVPAAWLLAAVAGVAITVGAASYWKQDPPLLVMMIGPIIATLAGVVAMRHNLWPRFFFFAAAFLLLIGFRGGHVLARWLLGATRGNMIALAGGAGVLVLSAITVPGAWKPKQDLPAAARMVAEARRPDDAIATVDIVATMVERYVRIPGAQRLHTLQDLDALEKRHPRTIVLVSFPIRARAVAGDIMARLESPAYRTLARVPATVAGGEILVLIHERSQPGA